MKNMKETNYNITLRDLVVLNTLLYLYITTKKPVGISSMVRELGCSYTSLRYCINKLSSYGLIDKVENTLNNREKYMYIPKNNIVFVIDRYTFLVIKEYGVTIQYNKRDLVDYVGKIIPFEELPEDLKKSIVSVLEDCNFFLQYSKLLKKKYIEMLLEQVEKSKQVINL